MDLLNDFPSLSEPLDTFSIKDCFMAAYPNFLAIGHLTQKSSEFFFQQNSYFKIPTYHFEDLYKAITDIGQFLIHDKQPKSNETQIFEADTYEFIWTFEENLVFLKIKNHPINKMHLQIDLLQFYFLTNGFKAIFFKPYCLKYFVHYAFYTFCELKTKEDLEKITFIKEAVEKTNELQLNFTKEELFFVSENILRHKNELILYLSLQKILPIKPF